MARAGLLAGLRAAVLGCATTCGMPEERAVEVMLAAHELAANAVRNCPGLGRLRIHRAVGGPALRVTDPGPASQDHRAPAAPAGDAARDAVPWPVERGHDPWLVREAADQLHVTCPAGRW